MEDQSIQYAVLRIWVLIVYIDKFAENKKQFVKITN